MDIGWLGSPGNPSVPKPLGHETVERNINVQTSQGTETATEPIQTEVFVTTDGVNNNGLMTAQNQIALIAEKQKTGPQSKVAEKQERTNGWTVQAMATTDRRIASHWLDRLKAKGYEAFVVKAEIKGQTWYRIRAGHFSTVKEAETLRTALRSEERVQDAFIAANTEPETLIALNPNQDPAKQIPK
jgi:cell division septation protein DedD